jgi:YVTN family beta-propeller protein
MRASGLRQRVARMRCATLCALWLLLALSGQAPTSGVAHADGGAPNLAYVVGSGANGGDLAIIDVAQRRLTGRVHLGGDPQGVVVSLDNRSIYIAQPAQNAVSVVDARTQRVVASIPVGHEPSALALDTIVSGYLYVANSASASVTVIDPARRRAIATIPVGKRPMGIAVASPASGISASDDGEVYVANADDDTVSVISEKRQRVIAVIPLPGGPLGVVVPAQGGVAYVGTRAGTIIALGLARHQLLGTLLRLRGSASGAMDYDAVTGQIYVPDPTGGVVQVLRPASPGGNGAAPNLPAEPARTLALGGGPAAVAITFDGAYGFVAQRDAGRVVMLDVGTHQTLATISVGGAPRAVVTGAYPPAPLPPAASGVGILPYVLAGIMVLGVAAFFLWRFGLLGRWLEALRVAWPGRGIARPAVSSPKQVPPGSSPPRSSNHARSSAARTPRGKSGRARRLRR